MKRVSQVLQCSMVIQGSWLPPTWRTQLFEKLDFLWRRISAKRTIFEEFLSAWLFIRWSLGFNKFKFPQVNRSDSSIQDNLQDKRSEIHVPRYDQWIQESAT